MVTAQEKARLIELFERSFETVQLMRVWIDDNSDAVNVKAHSVSLRVKGQIPVKLGTILGNFNCHQCELESLHNAPHTVALSFSCWGNRLTSLEGGPQSVGYATTLGGGVYSCSKNQLRNFVGAPQKEFTGYFVGINQPQLESVDGLPPDARIVDVTYDPDLPMLKLINQKKVNIRGASGHAMYEISDILNKYAGKGQQGAIACAAELAREGFKGNARW